jgi:hypothetical protein
MKVVGVFCAFFVRRFSLQASFSAAQQVRADLAIPVYSAGQLIVYQNAARDVLETPVDSPSKNQSNRSETVWRKDREHRTNYRSPISLYEISQRLLLVPSSRRFGSWQQ